MTTHEFAPTALDVLSDLIKVPSDDDIANALTNLVGRVLIDVTIISEDGHEPPLDHFRVEAFLLDGEGEAYYAPSVPLAALIEAAINEDGVDGETLEEINQRRRGLLAELERLTDLLRERIEADPS